MRFEYQFTQNFNSSNFLTNHPDFTTHLDEFYESFKDTNNLYEIVAKLIYALQENYDFHYEVNSLTVRVRMRAIRIPNDSDYFTTINFRGLNQTLLDHLSVHFLTFTIIP